MVRINLFFKYKSPTVIINHYLDKQLLPSSAYEPFCDVVALDFMLV